MNEEKKKVITGTILEKDIEHSQWKKICIYFWKMSIMPVFLSQLGWLNKISATWILKVL